MEAVEHKLAYFELNREQKEVFYCLTSKKYVEEALKDLGKYLRTIRVNAQKKGQVYPIKPEYGATITVEVLRAPEEALTQIQGHIFAAGGMTRKFPHELELSVESRIIFDRPSHMPLEMSGFLSRFRFFELMEDGHVIERRVMSEEDINLPPPKSILTKDEQTETETDMLMEVLEPQLVPEEIEEKDLPRIVELMSDLPSTCSISSNSGRILAAEINRLRTEKESSEANLRSQLQDLTHRQNKMEEEKTTQKSERNRFEAKMQRQMDEMKQNLQQSFENERTEKIKFQNQLQRKTEAMNKLQKNFDEEKISKGELQSLLEDKKKSLQEIGFEVQSLKKQNEDLQKTTKSLEDKLKKVKTQPVNASLNQTLLVKNPVKNSLNGSEFMDKFPNTSAKKPTLMARMGLGLNATQAETGTGTVKSKGKNP
jgi:hypothetical protein